MIELYTWSTPNGRKVSIGLEEMGLPYELHPVDLTKNEASTPEFARISPNGRIPAIIDRETGVRMMESGAILMYLAEKSGKFWPPSGKARWETVQWLIWQMAGFGPQLGQIHHFVRYNPGKSAYAEERFLNEGRRLYGVLDRRLGEAEFVAGDYSIADMAIFPWAARFEWQTIDLNAYPNILRWYRTVAARPAVQKGYDVPATGAVIPMP